MYDIDPHGPQRRAELDRILNGAAPLNIKAVQLFERVERLARTVQSEEAYNLQLRVAANISSQAQAQAKGQSRTYVTSSTP